ncbi:MAG: hypothetical protein ABJQ29_03175 [Luteolibacter sp.]
MKTEPKIKSRNLSFNGRLSAVLMIFVGSLFLTKPSQSLAAPVYPADSFTQISPAQVTRQFVAMIQAGSRLVRISSRGDVEISEDNGNSWVNRSPGVLIELNDIAWTGNRLVAVGRNGRIIGSDNLGVTWVNQPSNATGDYYSISWTGTHLLVSGINGLTSQSADEGDSWETYYFLDPGQFYGTNGVGNTWTIVGTNSRILFTLDDGESWFAAREGVVGTPTLNDIIFTGTVFIVVGEDGTILRGSKPEFLDPVNSGTTVELTGIRQVGSRIFAFGGQEHGGSSELQTIIYTDDDGLTWSTAFEGIVGRVTGVAGVAPNLVAVGSSELAARSSDGGATWTPDIAALTAPTTDDFFTMIESSGLIVGVGREGAINTSSDGGRTWSERDSQTSVTLRDVMRTGNRLITVGDAGTVRVSDDNGQTWQSKSVVTNSFFLGLADTGSSLVIVGATSSATAPIAYFSTDNGETWSPATLPVGGFLFSVTWTGSRLVAVGSAGECMISDDDGRTWSKVTTDSSQRLLEIKTGNGVQIASGENATILRSIDNGSTWQPATVDASTFGSIDKLVFDGSSWFALSWSGLMSSTDSGLTWVQGSHYITQNDCSLVHDGSKLILANTTLKEVYSSIDAGKSWIGLNVKTIRNMNSFASKSGIRVAVGDIRQIMVSEDGGFNWTISSAPLLYNDLNDVQPTPDGFIIVGDSGLILTSETGAEWTLASFPGGNTDLQGVAAGGGRLVAGGEAGNVFVSTDAGINWTSYPTGVTTDLLAVTYGNGQFLASGDSGVILTSLDGETWTPRISGTDKRLFDLVWTGTRYLAVGGTSQSSSGGGIILSSDDGISWAIREQDLNIPPQAIEIIGTRAVVVGTSMVGISDDGGLNWSINNGSLTFFQALHWDGSVLLAGGANNNLWVSQGNAEGLAALGLIPNLEVRNEIGALLTNGIGEITALPVLIGEQGDPMDIRISNTGTAPLAISGVIPGTQPSDDFDLDVTELVVSLAPGEMTNFSVTFTPNSSEVLSETYTIGSNDPDEPTFTVTVAGDGLTPQNLFSNAMAANGLIGNDALADASPYSDGISNLLKYAFNLDLTGPDIHLLEAMGNSGLPVFQLTEVDDTPSWQLIYIRRKASGLIYQPQCSENLQNGTFEPISGIEKIESIDDTWERVKISAQFDPSAQPVLFGRVMVGFRPENGSP